LELSVPKSSEPIVHLPILAPREDEVRSLLAAKLPAPPDKLLQVGDIAKLSGKTVRAIHHYEELGLLQPARPLEGAVSGCTTRGGRPRPMDRQAARSRAELPRRSRRSSRRGSTAPRAPRAMAELRAIYQKKLEETRAQIAHLPALERELEASIAWTRATPATPAESAGGARRACPRRRVSPSP
jgi:hypothetical protein